MVCTNKVNVGENCGSLQGGGNPGDEEQGTCQGHGGVIESTEVPTRLPVAWGMFGNHVQA